MDLSSIDPNIGASIVNLGASLTTLALKSTATIVHGKIESLKKENNIDTVRTVYDDVINQLLSERDDAVRIAQAYKQELEKVVISDEDIEYLQQTISKVFDLVKSLQLVNLLDNDPQKQAAAKASIDAVESIKNLVSKDVLKTMQLLGFNYKAAIGEPLTQICAKAISNLGSKSKPQPMGSKSGKR